MAVGTAYLKLNIGADCGLYLFNPNQLLILNFIYYGTFYEQPMAYH